MDAVAFGLSTLDLCIRYGKELYAVCQAYKHADLEIRESLLAIEGVWLKTEHQVEALRKMWNGLDEKVQIHQNNVLALLQERLQTAVVVIDGLDTSSSEELSLKTLFGSKGHVKKLKYAVYAKGKLEKIVIDLDRWHAKFDPSWYLLTRSAVAVMDEPIVSTQANSSKELKIIRELRRAHRTNVDNSGSRHSVFLPNDFSIQGRSRILNTSAQIGYAAHKPVIIDTQILTRNVDVQLATKDARDIARILGNVDPNIFSLLTCRGVIKLLSSSDEITGFEFVFEVPATLKEPRSLRSFLLIASHDYPLENRFRLARLLARSISFLHATQIVHKNITPETVVLLTDPASNLESPFLVGFENFRGAGSRTYMSGDTFWEKNLYRHPKRQGKYPEEEYKMQHDIYSLGVCLLEIGLGTSFLRFEASSQCDENPKGAVPGPVLDIAEALKKKDIRARAFHIKRELVALAESRLPQTMGTVYTNVVLSCLKCLDPDNEDFGDENEFTDEDGILVGVRYIEKVLYQIEEIRF